MYAQSPFVTLVGDTRGIGGAVKQLDQAAAGESAGFEDVLHGLVVGVGVGADVAVMLEGPGDAVAGGMLDEAGGRDASSLGKVSPHWVGLPLRAISSRARA